MFGWLVCCFGYLANENGVVANFGPVDVRPVPRYGPCRSGSAYDVIHLTPVGLVTGYVPLVGNATCDGTKVSRWHFLACHALVDGWPIFIYIPDYINLGIHCVIGNRKLRSGASAAGWLRRRG